MKKIKEQGTAEIDPKDFVPPPGQPRPKPETPSWLKPPTGPGKFPPSLAKSPNKNLYPKFETMKKQMIVQMSDWGDLVQVTKNPDGTVKIAQGEFEYKQPMPNGQNLPLQHAMTFIDSLTKKFGKIRGYPLKEADDVTQDQRPSRQKPSFWDPKFIKDLHKDISKGGPGARKRPSAMLSQILPRYRKYVVVQFEDWQNVVKVEKNPDGTYSVLKGEPTFKAPVGPVGIEDAIHYIDKLGKNKPTKGVLALESKNTMNNIDIIRKELLRRKIQEHFSKNLKAESVIIKSSIGGTNTLWKVTRKGSDFNVVEVNTSKSEYLLSESLKEAEEPKEDDPTPPEEQDAGIETSKAPPEPETAEPAVEPETPKTGEELQLDQLVQNKPVKNIDVFSDKEGNHVLLDLAGLSNPVDIIFTETGEAKYKLGDLSRTLSTKEKSEV